MTQPFNFYGAAATQGNADEYDEDDLVGYSSARSYMATQPFEEEKQAAPEAPPTVQNSSFYGGATQPFANELGDLFDNVEGPASPEEPHEKDSNEVQPTAQLYQTQMFDSKNTASSSTDQISPESPSHNESTGYPQTQMFGGESQDDTESPASPKGDETDQPSIENHYQTQLFATGPSESQNLSDLDNFQHQHAAATQPFEVADESADVSELLGDTADLDEGESSLQAKYAKDENDSDEGVGTKKKSRAAVLEESDQESEAGEILRDIFGASDEEGEGEFEGFNEKDPDGLAEGLNDSGQVGPADYGSDGEDDTEVRSSLPPDFEYDFDVMMRKRKAENSKARRKRKDIDVINDSDELIQFLCEQMKEAAREDRELNQQGKPAMRKRKLLPQVLQQLKKQDLQSAFIDGGIISVMTEWISPLPDKSLPALEIRTEFFKLLNQFPALPSDILKSSNIGKAVMYLYKNPKETRENKSLAAKLISEWARPIFNIQTDFRSLTKEERVQRDLEHMPQTKKKRTNSVEENVNGLQAEKTRPGEKGFIPRARVPQPSTKDYIVRPKWNIGDGENVEKKISTGKKSTLLDRKLREFKERTKQTKAVRAVAVSVSGNKM